LPSPRSLNTIKNANARMRAWQRAWMWMEAGTTLIRPTPQSACTYLCAGGEKRWEGLKDLRQTSMTAECIYDFIPYIFKSCIFTPRPELTDTRSTSASWSPARRGKTTPQTPVRRSERAAAAAAPQQRQRRRAAARRRGLLIINVDAYYSCSFYIHIYKHIPAHVSCRSSGAAAARISLCMN